MKELEIYIHIPFCVRKCDYCDFLSAPGSPEERRDYVRRLAEEIRFYAPQFQGYRVCSIFFGGGTPSVLDGRQIGLLMDCLRENYQIDADAEISMECNPGTLGGGKAAAFVQAGVNRISLGLQSADEDELFLLGRIHTYGQFLESFDAVRKAGCRNINVDLMSGLPGQKPKSWEKTLKQVSGLRPEHISAYSLIIEKGTPFYERYRYDEARRERGEKPILLPTEEEEREMYEMTRDLLSRRGYYRYEISNYARDGFECRHNIGYWMRKNYLGLGLGASSLIENVRFANVSSLKEYMEQPFSHRDVQHLEKKSRIEEYLFLGLRLSWGIDREEFGREFGTSLESVYGGLIRRLTQEGLLEEAQGRILLTSRGVDVSNYVLAQFLL